MSSQINNADSKEGSDQKKKGSFRDKIMNEIIKKNLSPNLKNIII